VVFAGAIIQPDAVLGRHAIINTSASIDHDCAIGDFVHLAPGTRLAGNVAIDEGAFLGIGAVAIPGVRVGAWTTVGAGAAIVDTLAAGIVAAGVPARPLRKA
jgi:UDP-perosamine 4-acetyltransferase